MLFLSVGFALWPTDPTSGYSLLKEFVFFIKDGWPSQEKFTTNILFS